MKKNSTGWKDQKPAKKTAAKGSRTGEQRKGQVTIGVDLGDKSSRYCALDETGEVLFEGSTATTKKGLAQAFGAMARSRIALEVGGHSPWVSRLLKSFGHEVIVANARQVKLITQSSRKNDKLDAQTLARLARVDPQLLRPIQHRSEEAQQHLNDDSGTGRAGGSADSAGEQRAGTGKSDRGAFTEMRCRLAGGGTFGSAAGRYTVCAEAVTGRSGIVNGKDPCLRRTKSSRSPGRSIRKPNSSSK
jgi:hypothetical protein